MHILHVLNALENTPGEHVEGVDALDKVGFDPWRLLLFNASQGGLDFLHCLVQHRPSLPLRGQRAPSLTGALPFSTPKCLDGPISPVATPPLRSLAVDAKKYQFSRCTAEGSCGVVRLL